MKDVGYFNKVLVSKWVWRILEGERSIRVDILKGRNEKLDREWCFDDVRRKKVK